MTFLDLAEGDKLAVVVVELHVGPSASHAESGQTEYIMLLVICSPGDIFCISAFSAFSVSTSSAHAHTHAHVLLEGDKLAFLVVELHVGPMRQCDALDKRM